MKLDVKRTAEARARHKAGVSRLRELFGSGRKGAYLKERTRWQDQSGIGRPVRLRLGVPPVRDAEHQEKHRRRKRVNAARRRNRR